jgi:alkylation response protein AidB-like acyl-CoA dehydrogenase
VNSFNFEPLALPAQTAGLRREVREFLREELVAMTPRQRAHTWQGFDAEFSRKLGEKGWIGMPWPREYGGQERSVLERYVVLEELLAAGAPVAAHWIADRQSGTLLLRFGREEVRRRYLPAMARGELFCCIGMSEPDSGSDLASIRTRARRVEGGWMINGSKLWTTNADKAHLMIALVRTSKEEDSRHAGLSQFIIELSSPVVTVNPVVDHTGAAHFGEVFFSDVFVADEMLLGNEGDGWAQVNAELALERSGPERYLSSYRLLEELVAAAGANPSPRITELIGELTAELWTLRQMSLSVAGQLAGGGTPSLEAAIVKDLGARFEQELPPLVQAALDDETTGACGTALQDVLDYLLRASPAFSLRGGTREILRGIIAKGLGLR